MLLTDNIINTLEQFQEMKNFQFLKVGDYMKTITRATKHPKYSYEGIEIHDIADWLLQE